VQRDVFANLCRARELLHTPDDFSIRDVAREARISPYHFIRQFEALFGETPHQYRIRGRVDRAKELLAAGHHSVTDVCMEVGFASLGSFSDLFTRRVGVSPSAYRRRVFAIPYDPFPGCLSLMALAMRESVRRVGS
jgi:AraC-like DNA-binding protein